MFEGAGEKMRLQGEGEDEICKDGQMDRLRERDELYFISTDLIGSDLAWSGLA